jgi:hypothetical protein
MGQKKVLFGTLHPFSLHWRRTPGTVLDIIYFNILNRFSHVHLYQQLYGPSCCSYTSSFFVLDNFHESSVPIHETGKNKARLMQVIWQIPPCSLETGFP